MQKGSQQQKGTTAPAAAKGGAAKGSTAAPAAAKGGAAARGGKKQ